MHNADSEGDVSNRQALMSERGRVFGKRLSDYLAFQKVFLILIAIAGITRLGLSLAGVPDATVKWFSMTAVGTVGIFYYGAVVHTSGFGSFKQLLPLVFIQNVLANSITIAGIALSMAGLSNIFAAPEYSGSFVKIPPQMQSVHILGHLIGGMGVFSIIGWGVASLVMLITKKFARPPTLA